jgi:quercetin dioxygenase-like cupin family protein
VIIPLSSLSPFEFSGLRIFDYSAGRDWAASIAVIEVEPASRHPEARSKRSDKYYLVTGGEVTFELDGQEHLLSSGDFCFVRRGQRFAYANRSSERATLVLVHTPPFDINDEEFIQPD